MIRPAQAVFLDFDGVVLESLQVKTDAFRALFCQSEHVDRIVAHHAANPGVSRYTKFAHVYETMLKRPLPRAEMARLDRRFSRLVRDGVLTCRFVTGARGFLRYASRRVPLFVASAAPERELRRIVRARGVAEYFAGVFGSPLSKTDAIRRVIDTHRLDPRAVLFVGDAESDRVAARAAGVRFVWRTTPGARLGRGPAVGNLRELQQMLKDGTCGLRL